MEKPKYTTEEWKMREDISGFVIYAEEFGGISFMPVGNLHPSYEEHKANAERIIKCVNMHDELIELARDFMRRVEKSNDALGIAYEKADELVRQSERGKQLNQD